MVRGLLPALLLAVVTLAGCSSDAGSKEDPEEEDDTFQDIEVDVSDTTGAIRGVVVDQAIRPLASAQVTLTVPGAEKQTASTTENGAFGFGQLPPGTYFLSARKLGYNATQVTAEVVAGVADPKPVTILLEENPSETPYVVDLAYEGFITCGAAIIVTSVGCTTVPAVAEQLGDSYIWRQYFETMPSWAQGELVWDQTQPAGGYLIWEMVRGGTNNHPQGGYRETTSSPALAYWDNATIEENWDHDTEPVSERGISYRVFGGPHPSCTPAGFGCGLTINQDFSSYIHIFYNWIPDEGWRFTVDGPPVQPT